MGEEPKPPQRLIRFTTRAKHDFAAIYNSTEATWGQAQAVAYIRFLYSQLQRIADDPELGKIIEGFPEYRAHLAKSSSRRSAAGHRIFYSVGEKAILVIRLLHTSMQWDVGFTESE